MRTLIIQPKLLRPFAMRNLHDLAHMGMPRLPSGRPGMGAVIPGWCQHRSTKLGQPLPMAFASLKAAIRKICQ